MLVIRSRVGEMLVPPIVKKATTDAGNPRRRDLAGLIDGVDAKPAPQPDPDTISGTHEKQARNQVIWDSDGLLPLFSHNVTSEQSAASTPRGDRVVEYRRLAPGLNPEARPRIATTRLHRENHRGLKREGLTRDMSKPGFRRFDL
jgi:hypothetical protein